MQKFLLTSSALLAAAVGLSPLVTHSQDAPSVTVEEVGDVQVVQNTDRNSVELQIQEIARREAMEEARAQIERLQAQLKQEEAKLREARRQQEGNQKAVEEARRVVEEATRAANDKARNLETTRGNLNIREGRLDLGKGTLNNFEKKDLNFSEGKLPANLGQPLQNKQPQPNFDEYPVYPAGPNVASTIAQPRPAKEVNPPAAQRMDRQTAQLVGQFAAAKDDAQRVELRSKLQTLLKEQFAARQNERRAELEELEAEVKTLREKHAQREAQQDRIINDRLQQLLNDAQGLGWSMNASQVPEKPVADVLIAAPHVAALPEYPNVIYPSVPGVPATWNLANPANIGQPGANWSLPRPAFPAAEPVGPAPVEFPKQN